MKWKSPEEMKRLKQQEKQRNFERCVLISLVALTFQSIAVLIMVISLLLRI
ncbi:MAG: hypothetical protein K2N51_09515 [Lachnospiraceae bacterium]|nr:hypothetical protein [Lachnospiraceae bacterium]